jgi:hypothetical protein
MRRAAERYNSAAAAALRASELRETRIAAAVCWWSDRFSGARAGFVWLVLLTKKVYKAGPGWAINGRGSRPPAKEGDSWQTLK